MPVGRQENLTASEGILHTLRQLSSGVQQMNTCNYTSVCHKRGPHLIEKNTSDSECHTIFEEINVMVYLLL